MAYTPDANNLTEPTDSRPAASAAEEFRVLKAKVAAGGGSGGGSSLTVAVVSSFANRTLLATDLGFQYEYTGTGTATITLPLVAQFPEYIPVEFSLRHCSSADDYLRIRVPETDGPTFNTAGADFGVVFRTMYVWSGEYVRLVRIGLRIYVTVLDAGVVTEQYIQYSPAVSVTFNASSVGLFQSAVTGLSTSGAGPLYRHSNNYIRSLAWAVVSCSVCDMYKRTNVAGQIVTLAYKDTTSDTNLIVPYQTAGTMNVVFPVDRLSPGASLNISATTSTGTADIDYTITAKASRSYRYDQWTA